MAHPDFYASDDAAAPPNVAPAPRPAPSAGPMASRKQFLLLSALVLGGGAACDSEARRSRPTDPAGSASASASASASTSASASASASASPDESTGENTSATEEETSGAATSGEEKSSANASESPLLSREEEEEIIARFSGQTPRQWGMDMPGILSVMDPRIAQQKARELGATGIFALTLDACGGPHGSQYDGAIIDNLRATSTPATLFLNQRWVQANPRLARELRDDPLFEIANHGSRHCPLSVTGRSAYKVPGTANAREALAEVMENQRYLSSELGIQARFFRSGTAHYDDVAVAIAQAAGLQIAGFAINADWGTTASRAQIIANVAPARGGEIIIAHMNQPQHDTAEGLQVALAQAAERGLIGVKMSEVFPA